MSRSDRTIHEEVREATMKWAAEILMEPDLLPSDNFLELGGHSILALRLCDKAKERFGAEYDMLVLFEGDLASTAQDLADRIAGV